MSVLSDPAYIVHNLRLCNLRLDDRTSDKVITFPPPFQLLSNEYIKTAGPDFPEMGYCYSPNISHDYMMLSNSSLLTATNDSSQTLNDNNTTNTTQTTKPAYGIRGKYDRRRIQITSENEPDQNKDQLQQQPIQEEAEKTEREIDIGDITIDSMNSPIDLSPADSTITGRFDRSSIPLTHTLMSPAPIRPNTPPPSKIGMNFVDGLLSEPIPLTQPSPVSLLTSLIIQQKSKEDNPFAEEFLRIAGMGETTPVKLKIYLPSSDKPKDPMQVVVKREATVEDVIGYILYQYYNEGRTPLLSDELSTVVQWNLRIVEDDGEIDDDLPAVERTLKIGRFSMNQRFAMNQFALCEATPAQVQINENLYAKSGRVVVRPKRQQAASSSTGLGPPDPPGTESGALGDGSASATGDGASMDANGVNGGMSAMGQSGRPSMTGTISSSGHAVPRADPLIASTQHYVRVRLHTGHEVKHTTTVEILPKMLVSGVIDYICHKRKMNPAEWSLVVADTHHVLPLDGAAEDISNSTELALVPKASVADIPGSGVSYLTSTEVYREYTLNRKRRGGYVGHHEQVLAIDGDYIRIMPTSSRNLLFDSGKTASYLKNTIHDCKQSTKAPSHFKLAVIRGDREKKTYEFEAKSPQQARKFFFFFFFFFFFWGGGGGGGE
ncbi:stress-activated map kinase interacting protein 1-domain-containing protein [Linnemannia elongata]|nr:stress-activated map kinase interacting protein 1-domain-containing protein [Linnemannia elongata]